MRTTLRQDITRLRQAIGDHTAPPPFLLVEREQIQFNPASKAKIDCATSPACSTSVPAMRIVKRSPALSVRPIEKRRLPSTTAPFWPNFCERQRPL
jgi:DNA-binding SARP family transcriptional activator